MAKTLKEQYDDLRLAKGRGGGDDLPLALSQAILAHGAEIRASDIHIEPSVAGARVRYRIDGLLHEMLQIPPEVRDPLTRALKVRANMATDTVSRSKPQDNRLELEFGGRKLDLRVSSFPTIHGDVLAIRVLDRSSPLRPLEQLGMSPDQLAQFQKLITRPNGLVLVTGPANSGKTTTLYAALNKLRSPHIKIVTLEDPVEYQLDGIAQAQFNPAVGVTFATGLRAILRQDANIILVGEIRDTETADISVRAALTGHLVFSTMHTRHSLGATTRLIDMGIEPHLIIASLSGIVAQRLVRVICTQCKAPDAIAAKTFERLCGQLNLQASSGAAGLSRGAGCPTCNGTGYRGRIGIFEFLVLTEQVKRMLLDREHTPVYKAMVGAGLLQTMLVDGLTKASQGLTTIEEVLRVTGEGED
jgi:type II secretory ATPase GspE/PulE/Tfp pilus assembly ATPase PilB-like protein